MRMHENEAKYCGHCHEKLEKGARYCRHCGAPAAEGVRDYEPDFCDVQCIYGPCPTKWRFRCKVCGRCWESILMGGRPEYCTECGSETHGEACSRY